MHQYDSSPSPTLTFTLFCSRRPLKRVSYAVECEEPEVPPEPPSVHMETNEPFFLNTIPLRPLSFAVDKEWMSELLVAKRLEMQKRDGGVKYAYKNFAFVYWETKGQGRPHKPPFRFWVKVTCKISRSLMTNDDLCSRQSRLRGRFSLI